MPRCARIIAVDYPHHVIQRGNNKQPVFYTNNDRYLYLTLLKKYNDECQCKIHAYCLMINHVHMLIVPQHEHSLSKLMQKISLVFTQHINRAQKRTGRLWECRFYSSIVDTDKYLLSVCRYIERNPIRANIVKTPLEYKWSSAKANTLGYNDNIVTPVSKINNQNIYSDFINAQENDSETELIRKCTLSGKPIGDNEFLEDISEKTGLSMQKLHIRANGRPKNRDTSLFS
jgi:putative transposase